MNFRSLENLLESEWLEARRECVSSSDIASILGIGYDSPRELSQRKLGLIGEKAPNERMELGKYLEPYAVERWERRTGILTKRGPSLCIHAEREWQSSTLDRIIDERRILEAKISFDYPDDEWGEDGSGVIPAKFATQTTWAMDTTGAEECVLAAGFMPYFHRAFIIKYDPELAALLVAAGAEFREAIKGGEPLPEDWASSYSLDALKKLESVKLRETKILGEDALEKAARFEALKTTAKLAKDEADEIKTELIEMMGGCMHAVLPNGGEFTRSVVNRKAYSVAETSYQTFRVLLEPKASKRKPR